jgi:hypothetical protein
MNRGTFSRFDQHSPLTCFQDFVPFITQGGYQSRQLVPGYDRDIAGFIGDLELVEVDLEIIQKLFPGWYDEVASSKRGALRTVSVI